MEPYCDWIDEALMEAFQCGLDPAYDELYRRWFDRLVGWLQHQGLQSAEAEDLANDVLVRIWNVNRP